MSLFNGATRYPGIWGDPVPRVVGGAPPFPTLPNQMNPVPVPDRTQPAPPRRPSFGSRVGGAIGGAIGTAFGGADDPNLTPEQNRQARSQALIRAGLQVILANNQGAGTMAALASGALAGQEAGIGERQNIYMSTQEERLKQALNDPEILGRLTPQQVQMIKLLPPQEAAKMLTSIAFAAPPEAKVVGDRLVSNDGRVIYEPPQEEKDMWEGLPSEIKAALFGAGIEDPSQLTPEQRREVFSAAESYRRAGATTVNVDTARRQDFADTNTLATQFRTDIGSYQEVANGFAAVESAARNPSHASDISLMFAYMKMLDPGSVVREGEFATAQQAGNIPERVRAKYNELVTTKGMFSPVQRADFVAQARRIAETRRNQMKPVLGRYRDRAIAGGVDPSMVIYDPFEEVGLGEDVLDSYLR